MLKIGYLWIVVQGSLVSFSQIKLLILQCILMITWVIFQTLHASVNRHCIKDTNTDFFEEVNSILVISIRCDCKKDDDNVI